LSKENQRDYITAVQCFLKTPSITPPEVSPGARNRLDDFVTTHIFQTMTAHFVVGDFRGSNEASLIFDRVIFSRGIVIISQPTSRLCEMNAVTLGPIRMSIFYFSQNNIELGASDIGIGISTRLSKTLGNLHFGTLLMASEGTAHILKCHPVLHLPTFLAVQVADVYRMVLSRIWW